MTETDLVAHFDRYFYIRRALSEHAKQLSFRIRYQVYCTELNFEDPKAFPDCCERDACDSYSDHFLIYHRGHPDEVAGTVRLVVPQKVDQLLPIEIHCFHSIDPTKFSIDKMAPGACGELSRLAVTSRFRRRKGEVDRPFVLDDSRSRFGFANFPYIAVGLYMAAAASSYSRGINMVVVMMEPRLARHLSRFGILFEQIGPLIEFHGQRAPYAISHETFRQWLKEPVWALFEFVSSEIDNPANHI